MMVLRVSSIFVLGLALLAAGCASRGAPATVPTGAEQGAAANAEVAPGDQVALRIWNEPEISDAFTVAESGYVPLPKLGAVRAAAYTVAELEDTLRLAYTEYLRNPSVNIVILRR